jgi:hypothetical protein
VDEWLVVSVVSVVLEGGRCGGNESIGYNVFSSVNSAREWKRLVVVDHNGKFLRGDKISSSGDIIYSAATSLEETRNPYIVSSGNLSL